MKKYIIICLLFFLNVYAIYAQQGYWFQNSFVELVPKDSCSFYFQLNEKTSINEFKLHLNSKRKDASISSMGKGFIVRGCKSEDFEDIYHSNIYGSNNCEWVIVLPCISFEMNSGFSASDIIKRYSNYLTLKRIDGRVYRLDCNMRTSREVLDIAARISKEENVRWCEPVKLSSWHSYNTYYSQQYYLKNTGQNGGLSGVDINVEPAWSIISGSPNVTVAIIDTGIDFNHEDMDTCVVNGYTVGNPNGYGIPQNVNFFNKKGHGVACAGIVGALNNNIGIRGIASGVKLLPVNIVPDSANLFSEGFANDCDIANAILWAGSRADILSCSWGGGAYSQDIVNAIDSVRENGRNGKGCVVIFASGNNNVDGTEGVAFPSDVPGVITVGAIKNTGVVWDYSQRGNGLDLVAPSGDGNSTSDIVTTDRMGDSGYNTIITSTYDLDLPNMNYTKKFNGTSAACPQVAGVAALMLSANPNLYESEVRDFLKNTARKLSGMNGANWTDEYGYGLVNACKAVVKASTLRISGPSDPCGTTSIYSVTNVPTSYSVDWSIMPEVYLFGNNSILTTNSPQQKQCTIYNDGLSTWSTILHAVVKDEVGDTITTLSKRIRSTFDLTFSQDGNTINGVTYPTIPTSNVKSDETINSDYFDGMTISHTGAAPLVFSDFNGEITFKFPTVTSTQTMYVHGHDGCKSMRLKVQVSPDANIPIPTLNLMPTTNGYDILLTYEDNEEATQALANKQWTLTIINASTSERLLSRRVI